MAGSKQPTAATGFRGIADLVSDLPGTVASAEKRPSEDALLRSSSLAPPQQDREEDLEPVAESTDSEQSKRDAPDSVILRILGVFGTPLLIVFAIAFVANYLNGPVMPRSSDEVPRATPAFSQPAEPPSSSGSSPSGPTFGVGSTKAEVRAVQGQPDQTSANEWRYGSSSVYFGKDRVTGWRTELGSPLKVAENPQER